MTGIVCSHIYKIMMYLEWDEEKVLHVINKNVNIQYTKTHLFELLSKLPHFNSPQH
jgi:hypothetical protein